MLCLTRKPEQKIVIDGPCVVTVLGVKRNGDIRIGIDAEPTVNIARAELLDCDGKRKPKIGRGEE